MLTVRDLDPQTDDLTGWLAVIKLAFMDHHGPVGPDEVTVRRPGYRESLLSCAQDGDQVVGTIRSWPTDLTVPGGSVPAAAVSAVTVLPTHRRRGAMSAMVNRHLQAARDRGAAVAVLIASEATIYGRFGFGPCTESADWTVDLRAARLRPEVPRGGRVRIVPPEQLRPVAPELYRAGRTAGDIDRPEPAWWDPRLGVTQVPNVTDDTVVTALATDDAGTPVGYLRYTATSDWVDRTCRTQVHVHDLRAVTAQAYAELWAYLVGLDLVATVVATERPVDEALPLLLVDPRAARQTGRCDFLWSRVLDPVAALTSRSYERDGDVTLQVVDRLDPSGGSEAGPADGCFRLRVVDGRAGCTRVPDADPDLVLPVDVLGAVWLGAGDLPGHARAGRATERVPGALDRLAGLLRTTAAPWSSTWF